MLNVYVNSTPYCSPVLCSASKRAEWRQAFRGTRQPKPSAKELLQHLPFDKAFRFCELCGESASPYSNVRKQRCGCAVYADFLPCNARRQWRRRCAV